MQSHTSPKWEKNQNQALKIVGGFTKGSPIHVMENELRISPLFLRRQYLAYKYILKILSWSDSISVNTISELSSLCNNSYWASKKKPLLATSYNELKQLQISSLIVPKIFSLDVWVSAIQVKKAVKCELYCIKHSHSYYDNNLMLNEVISELASKYTGHCKIFTDGSKNVNGGGAEFFV